jgi:hypothetical protein
MKRTAVAWEWEGVDVDTTAPKKDNGDKVRCSPSHFVLVFGLELQCLAGGWAVVTTGVTDGWMDGWTDGGIDDDDEDENEDEDSGNDDGDGGVSE